MNDPIDRFSALELRVAALEVQQDAVDEDARKRAELVAKAKEIGLVLVKKKKLGQSLSLKGLLIAGVGSAGALIAAYQARDWNTMVSVVLAAVGTGVGVQGVKRRRDIE